ncbi:hypothetical protein NDU88_005975 [Pleurodeles waltl]|uniref:Uncharacterized protein n=1 Tax=Pleurodeles waltl TaxID=8319 RepID=A0AAV7RPY3_PLEWA|nr:hypothetical protein NDU88_005975 [Pleurodeles waltl]
MGTLTDVKGEDFRMGELEEKTDYATEEDNNVEQEEQDRARDAETAAEEDCRPSRGREENRAVSCDCHLHPPPGTVARCMDAMVRRGGHGTGSMKRQTEGPVANPPEAQYDQEDSKPNSHDEKLDKILEAIAAMR